MFKKMDEICGKFGKWMLEHTYTYMTIETIIGVVWVGTGIACNIRKLHLMRKTK